MLSHYPDDLSASTGRLSAASLLCNDFKSAARVAPHDDRYIAQTEVRQDEWDEILQMFDDSSLMQTWSYGAVRWGEKNLSHVVLKKNGRIVAASQVIKIKVPFLPVGLSYVKWGLCWQVKGETRDAGNFRQMLQALYGVYVVERGLLLRIFPNAVAHDTGTLRAILEEQGFQRDSRDTLTRTVLVDLSYPLEELRRSLKGSWRRNLVLAERNGLTVSSGVDDDSFRDLMTLYDQMKTRKVWEPIADVKYFERVQTQIAAPFKMKCMVCRHNGVPVSGIAVSRIGNTAVLLLAATGDLGLTLRSSYLLQWKVLEWLKSSNIGWYDLFGINQETHPGTYQFKSGLGGRLGLELDYVGSYQAGTSPMAKLSIQVAERAQATLVGLKRTLGRVTGNA